MSEHPLLNTKTYAEELRHTPLAILAAFETLMSVYMASSVRESSGALTPAALCTVQRGARAITHVFRMVLLYTRSLEAATHHASRASDYYCEFIAQITDDGRHYLQLAPRDAVMFAYKKTVYDINTEMRAAFVAAPPFLQSLKWVEGAIGLCVSLRALWLEQRAREGVPAQLAELERSQLRVVKSLAGTQVGGLADLDRMVDRLSEADCAGGGIAGALVVAVNKRVKRRGGRVCHRRLSAQLVRGDVETAAKLAVAIVV